MGKPNIAELAVAAWRFERWLDNLNAERKMAAQKSLREIKKFLDASDIEIVDPLGWKFDPGLAVEVVNNEAEDVNEEELIIIQTNSPIVKQGGAVIQYGKIILGQEVKEQKANNEIRTEPQQVATENADITESSKEAVLKQSKLYVGKDAAYWIRSFECKAIREGYQAVINVDSNVEVSVLLMDKQVFSEYCRGIAPRSPFSYVAKAGSSYVPLPYPDIWYMLAWPLTGHTCHEYILDMNCTWMQNKSDVELTPDVSQEPVKAESETSDNSKEESETQSMEKSSNEEEKANISVDENAGKNDVKIVTPVAEGTVDKKAVPDITVQELERLKKKNLSSFYTQSAVGRGLFQIHGKKKK